MSYDTPTIPTADQVAATEARFWSKVNKTETCWMWLGAPDKDGYGRIKPVGCRLMFAHRFAWVLAGNELTPGYVLDHHCHNRMCVRPDHLRQVSQKQNVENLGPDVPANRDGARGVCWDVNTERWRVRVGHHGVTHNIGWFTDLEKAKAAALVARLRLFTCNDVDRLAS